MKTTYSGIAALMLSLCGIANGAILSVDADSFAVGTTLTSAFSGATLSVVTGPNRPDGPFVVVGVDGYSGYNARNIATTGSLVFGNFPVAPSPAMPNGWEVDGRLFRADFASPTDWVSIDLFADDDDSGELRAYGAGGQLLALVSTGNLFASAFTATISRPTADIAYITAAGTYGESMFLDNLRFNVAAQIPEPGSLALLGLGLAGLGFSRRK